MKSSIVLVFAALVIFNCANSQIAITHLGQIYTENFDSLGTVNVVWNNEATLQGWSFVYSTNGINAGFVNTLFANAGEFSQPYGLNLGAAASPDRALGAVSGRYAFSPTNEFYYGARFINNSGQTIPYVNVNYFGEQWRDSSMYVQFVDFFYRIEGNNFLGDPRNQGWTSVPSLNFSSLQNTALPNEALNGNNALNRTNLTDNILINLAPGEQFWIRWSDTKFLNPPYTLDHTLGIDDLTITFTNVALTTNTPTVLPDSASNVLGVTLELKKPNPTKTLKFSQKGFKVKAWLSSTNTLTKASFAAFGGTNNSTNLTFTDFGIFKILTKGKLFKKKGVKAVAQTKGSGNKAGIGIAAGSSPITLVIKVDGTQGTNGAASAFFTNVFTNVK